MKAGHTPGPWRTMREEVDRDYIRIRGNSLGSRYKIANVITPTYERVPAQEAEETRANAKLIAAAPDLLDTLQKVLDSGKKGIPWAAVRDAIEKATGAKP